MQIYEELHNDHIKVLGLLDDLIDLPENSDPQALIKQIRDDLIPHSRAEEAVFYNVLRATEAAKEKISHSYREHLEVETMLRALQMTGMTHLDCRKTAERLRSTLTHHIQEEESEIFPMARQLLTEQEAQMLGEAFLKLKPQIKPEGFAKTTLELAANMMPPRLAQFVKGANLQSRI